MRVFFFAPSFDFRRATPTTPSSLTTARPRPASDADPGRRDLAYVLYNRSTRGKIMKPATVCFRDVGQKTGGS